MSFCIFVAPLSVKLTLVFHDRPDFVENQLVLWLFLQTFR